MPAPLGRSTSTSFHAPRESAQGVTASRVSGGVQESVGPPSRCGTVAGSEAARRSRCLISVGGGPRATATELAVMELLRTRRDDFRRIQDAGGKYDIRTVIVERKGAEALGRGNAWGAEHGSGTANTGPEGGKGSGGAGAGLLDYKSRLTRFVGSNRERLDGDAKDNPVVASLQAKAFDGTYGREGEATLACAAMTRARQGEEEQQQFLQALRQTTKAFPFYRVEVMANTSVERIDLSDPDRVRLALATGDTHEPVGELVADTVRLNTGTTLSSPVSDPAVQGHAYSQAMDPGALAAFLEDRGLLDDAGRLAPGKKLALGGTGLSAYDQLLALVPSMQLFVPDDSPLGYKVSDEARAKYQGAITFISNTEGEWIWPRHAHDPAWKQQADPLGNAKEQHALFLHQQGEEIFKAWAVLVDASIAVAQGMAPRDVRREGMGTPQLLESQQAGNLQSAQKLHEARQLQGDAKARALEEATHTLEGACRQADLSTILGLGMERDLAKAMDEMSTMAPLTFLGREGYLIHRAQIKAVTEPGTQAARDNADLVDRFDTIMGTTVTASPLHVHAAAALLFQAGIASHACGTYSDLKAGGPQRALSFTAKDGSPLQFDAFIVSPMFDRDKEPAVASLAGQVEPADLRAPGIGEVTLHRRIRDKKGRATRLEDYSLNGKGAFVGGGSKAYVFATDVNNRESGVDAAMGLALRRLAQEHLSAAGFPDPVEEADRLYRKHLPADEQHDEEARRFAPHFDKAMVKARFLEAAETAAGGDADDFRRLAETARSASTVKTRAALFDPVLREVVDRKRREDLSPPPPDVVDRFRAASKAYADTLFEKPAFRPVSNADYQGRFVDAPLHVHEKVYAEALVLAEQRLKAAPQPGFAAPPVQTAVEVSGAQAQHAVVRHEPAREAGSGSGQ